MVCKVCASSPAIRRRSNFANVSRSGKVLVDSLDSGPNVCKQLRSLFGDNVVVVSQRPASVCHPGNRRHRRNFAWTNYCVRRVRTDYAFPKVVPYESGLGVMVHTIGQFKGDAGLSHGAHKAMKNVLAKSQPSGWKNYGEFPPPLCDKPASRLVGKSVVVIVDKRVRCREFGPTMTNEREVFLREQTDTWVKCFGSREDQSIARLLRMMCSTASTLGVSRKFGMTIR